MQPHSKAMCFTWSTKASIIFNSLSQPGAPKASVILSRRSQIMFNQISGHPVAQSGGHIKSTITITQDNYCSRFFALIIREHSESMQ